MYQEPFRADHMMERDRREQRRRLIVGGSLALIAVMLVSFAFAGWHWAFHDLPPAPQTAAELWNVRREPAVTLTDREGRVLAVRGPLYARAVALESLPEHVPQAFLAIEDQRFYRHTGVDFRGVARALWRNFRAGATVEGGSTITMQLVKNLMLSPDRELRRKIQEMRLARALERQLSKTEILELYLNRIYLGARAYGIEAAAERYFDKSATELTLAEAALLAALPKAPSRLDPTINLDAARARAAQVLAAMEEAGYITATEHAEALAEPAEPVADTSDPNATSNWGHAFDMALTEAQRLVPGDIPDLIIRTTLDPALARAANETVERVLSEQGEAAHAGEAAIVLLAPDGAIRAFAGGRDYRDSQFNRAVQARRQPGSAFKPIVFAAALEAGYDPSSAVWDEPVDLEGWTPQNFSGSYRGLVTLQEALKRSINTVAVQVADEVGIGRIVEMGHRLGIRSDLPELPAIALGAAEVNLVELTAAYSVFANDGERREPYFILSITNSRGDVLYEHRDPGAERALETETARAMSTMLQDVVMTGTGRRAALPGRASAGKTGTSQSFRDAWFIGYTADYTAGVWVGNDDDSPMENVTGGGLPAQIWRDFMVQVHEGLPARALSAPAPRTRSEREERLAAFYSDLSAAFSELLEDGASPSER
ncbi:transglycosylase domain-containing protein [Maricaulis virginensis]|uniref:Penicillin-binding protein 1A n=1 Tax=Maricaulis virginensis TaxID=144022 RepID=A0A9W6II43_9PROT|nr:PBP1A family penicillin-binding protein [Maricaulis virginensis]GLK50688.1 penicillin-binding protein 1A [Maricaulis virginensis]